MSVACSTESAPARTASRAPSGPYEWIAIRLPARCATSTAAFISSNENVWKPVTSWSLPVEPYILIQSTPAPICSRATRWTSATPFASPGSSDAARPSDGALVIESP